MLFEKIKYADDFPINITIANIDEYPVHYHQDIEFVYVLKGKVYLKNGYCEYLLREGDIFTNSGHEVHRITSDGEENVVALIQISTHFFSQYFPTLSTACYRTYSHKSKTKKHDHLREKLLQILLQYSIKSYNYKSECTYLMIDVIKYLEKVFNLFAFEEDVVINFESGSQITIERISHIIKYIYQYYREKITLEDLAEMEHLSTFYLSHIIKDCTGMSFREFLCFARVEWSEIELLDTNKKISQVASDVGFSTTAYYEKHFYKWFKRTPLEHRMYYMHLVKSESNPERIESVSIDKVIAMVKHALSSFNSQKNNTSIVNCLRLDVNVSTKADPLFSIDHSLDVQITCEDFNRLSYKMFSYIDNLKPAKVTILSFKNDSEEDVQRLKTLMEAAGFNTEVRLSTNTVSNNVISYGNDSVAAALYFLSKELHSREKWITVRFRDYGNDERLLKGQMSAVTSQGVKKSLYYAYQLISSVNGDIICWGKQYCVIRNMQKDTTEYYIFVYNFNDSIYRLCSQGTTAHQVKNELNGFKDEIELNINIDLQPGRYAVIKYSLTNEKDIFSYMASVNFDSEFTDLFSSPEFVPTSPNLEVYTEDVYTSFKNIFSIKGVGMQMVALRLKGDMRSER